MSNPLQNGRSPRRRATFEALNARRMLAADVLNVDAVEAVANGVVQVSAQDDLTHSNLLDLFDSADGESDAQSDAGADARDVGFGNSDGESDAESDAGADARDRRNGQSDGQSDGESDAVADASDQSDGESDAESDAGTDALDRGIGDSDGASDGESDAGADALEGSHGKSDGETDADADEQCTVRRVARSSRIADTAVDTVFGEIGGGVASPRLL